MIKFSPTHKFFQKVRQGKLEWSQIMRSNDVLLGMPYNFIQFTGLQEISVFSLRHMMQL